MFDVDPKWAELVKERGNLPHDLQKRLPNADRGNSKGKSPGRPPMMPSPTSQQSSSQANLNASSMASQLNFPGLGNLNNSLLSGLSMGNFDPKNNPLLMPFGGLPNLGALGGLGNLGNLSNMSLTNSLFANLAGLGLPSLAGMEAALGANAATSSADTNVVNSSTKNTTSSSMNNSSSSSSNKNRGKMEPPTSKSSAPSTSSSSSLPTTTPFPFFFPNPSLLYTPLGLGALNPFSMQPGGVSSAYESLAQCGLLNPPSSSTAPSRKSTSGSSRQRDSLSSESLKRKEHEKKLSSSSLSTSSSSSLRYPMDPALTLQQYTDLAMYNEERRSRSELEKKETIELNDIADLSARFDRKSKEQEMKEALEQLSRTSAELLTRNIEELQRPHKRSRVSDNSITEQQLPSSLEVTLEPINKKSRVVETESSKSSSTIETNIDIEPIIRQMPIVSKPQTPTSISASTSTSTSTPTSTPQPTPASTPTPIPSSTQVQPIIHHQEESISVPLNISNNSNKELIESSPVEDLSAQQTNAKSDTSKSSSFDYEEDNKSVKTSSKKSRSGKRLAVEPPVERKNLRSSAGRQARAAAERQARMEGEQHSGDHENQLAGD